MPMLSPLYTCARRRSLSSPIALCAAIATAWACTERPVAEQAPLTNNLFLDTVNLDRIEKIDLLFMIDNSASMGDKQSLLAVAVPKLLERLVNPPCVVQETGEVIPASTPDALCARGEREFPPVKDVHVGVITSSLGTLGASGCRQSDVTVGRFVDDRAHMVATMRPQAPATYQNLGFLAWDNRPLSSPAHDPLATNDPVGLETHLGALVEAAGESGCGFEASLESWYRFLVDPNPTEFEAIGEGGRLDFGPQDQTLLQQRKAFLRPDSLVAILMLTDENDCSMRADGYGWLVGAGAHDYRSRPSNATTACDVAGPNDPCCASCAVTGALPAQCVQVAQDPKCAADATPFADPPNGRCWEQKRRFGVDLLYPTSRYAVALKSRTICPQSTFGDSDCACTRAKELGVPCNPGEAVPNPLYQDLATGRDSMRDPSLVFLAGIVGVPWQDIATPSTRDAANSDLQYMTAEELSATVPGQDFTVWDLILGNPSAGILPRDPYMVERPEPRTNLPPNPLIPAPMAAPDAATASASPINGHEWNAPHDGNAFDLQYACTFTLPDILSRTCSADTSGCDCPTDSDGATDELEKIIATRKPLCQDPATGQYETHQSAAKAYPGLRQLDVLKQAGSQAIVASICPKVLVDGHPNYGYNPAVNALVDRLKSRLGDKCLPRRLEPAPDSGQVPCRIVEALPPERCAEAVALPGRTKLDGGNIVQELRRSLQAQDRCDASSSAECEQWCFFEIDQLDGMNPGEPLHSCQNGLESGLDGTAGYCYVDADQGIGSPELLRNCPATEQRLLRFVGADTPRSGATTFYACRGATTRDLVGD